MKNLKTSKLFNIFILLSGFLISIWICKLIYEKQELKVISEVDHELVIVERKISEQLISSAEVLYSISNLFNAVEQITPEVFNKFTKQLIKRKESVLFVEWQPIVKESERESFIKMAREMGIKDFDFWEPDQKGVLVKAKKRDIHLPVLLAVSAYPTANTVGLDLSFSPERMNSKWESLETGEPRVSETFNVLMFTPQETKPPGFAMTIPVFNKNSNPQTVVDRKRDIFGFVAAVFDLEKLLSPSTILLKRHDLDFKIVDLENNKLVLEMNSGKAVYVAREIKMNVYGREWSVIVYAGEKFAKRFTRLSDYFYPSTISILFLILYLFLEINRKKSIALIKTQELLDKAAKEANAAAHSKAMFLANMSHELRTPLSSILAYGEIMKRETDESKRARYLDVILRSGRHLAQVIRDILDISKLEQSKFKLSPCSFKLESLINQLDELVVSQYENPDVRYIKKIDSTIDEILFGDEFRIKQILINLLSNAFKFTPQGEVSLSIVKNNVDSDRFNLVIEVSDSGKGMSQDFQKNVFEPFTQEDFSYSREHEGTGLGLSIVFRLVKLMGGSISLNSELNRGTTFIITLPFEKIKAAS